MSTHHKNIQLFYSFVYVGLERRMPRKAVKVGIKQQQKPFSCLFLLSRRVCCMLEANDHNRREIQNTAAYFFTCFARTCKKCGRNIPAANFLLLSNLLQLNPFFVLGCGKIDLLVQWLLLRGRLTDSLREGHKF